MKKRRFPRFSVLGIRGRVSLAERVEVINMSAGGIALKTNRRLEIGREHRLMIEGRDFRIELTAVAVWSKPTAARRIVAGESVHKHTVGLRFVEILSPQSQKLAGIFKEKRVGIRFRIRAKDMVLLDVDDPCEVELISRSGMLILTERPFEVEGAYLMEIFLPRRVPIRLRGRIASCLKRTQKHFDVGVEFLDMSADDRQRLDAFIESLSTWA